MIVVTVFDDGRGPLGYGDVPESRFFTPEGAADFQDVCDVVSGDSPFSWDECWDDDDPDRDPYEGLAPGEIFARIRRELEKI